MIGPALTSRATSVPLLPNGMPDDGRNPGARVRLVDAFKGPRVREGVVVARYKLAPEYIDVRRGSVVSTWFADFWEPIP